MKILNFRAENYKRIQLVEITPDGNLVQITGRNKQGKTSVLDALWAALAGGEASRATAQPIREGETQASVRLDLGEYIITRVWKKNDVGTLTVESPRGAKYGSPQKILDGIVGKRSMDPLVFVKLAPSEQVATLIAVLGDSLGFDPVDIERRRANAFTNRAENKKAAAALRARLEGFPEFPADTPTVETPAADLLTEHTKASEHNALLRDLDEDITDQRAQIEKLGQVIVDAQRRKDRAEAELTEARRQRAKMVDPIDTLAIMEKLHSVDATNTLVRGKQQRDVLATDLDELEEDVRDWGAELVAIAKEKAAGIAAAKLPIDGLSFDDSGVLYNGLALAQASGAEKRIVSFALAMALNPELRVIRIDEGESLDSEALAHIAELAAEHDYQVWISRVDESGKSGIIIEDGMVQA